MVDSLIRSEADKPEQLDLVNTADLEASFFEENEQAGNYTGERLFRHQPDKYKLICSCLAEGLPVRWIKSICHVSHLTIAGVRDREPAFIGTEKKRIGELFRVASKVSIETFLENVDKVKIKDAGDLQRLIICACAAAEKGELLLGGATHRIDNGHEEKIADLQAVFAALPAETGSKRQVDRTKRAWESIPEAELVAEKQSSELGAPRSRES